MICETYDLIAKNHIILCTIVFDFYLKFNQNNKQTHLKVHVPLVDPPDRHVRIGQRPVVRESHPDPAQRSGLDLERNILRVGSPQQPIVGIEIHYVIPLWRLHHHPLGDPTGGHHCPPSEPPDNPGTLWGHTWRFHSFYFFHFSLHLNLVTKKRTLDPLEKTSCRTRNSSRNSHEITRETTDDNGPRHLKRDQKSKVSFIRLRRGKLANEIIISYLNY